MLTLLGSLIGFLGSLIPDFLRIFKDSKDKIHELKSELNLQNLQVWSNFPGVKHKDCMKSIKLFIMHDVN